MHLLGTLPDGRPVRLHTLLNRRGSRARVVEWGASLQSLEVPDRAGALADVTLAFDTLEGWRGNSFYLGGSVGRFGNRVRDGRVTVAGRTHSLSLNNTPGGIPCHLHGGFKGFDRVLWTTVAVSPDSVTLEYLSPDGEEGYPGALRARVTYTLTENNELVWEATATTDAPTVVNLVHHSYWNLSGRADSILDHELQLDADAFLPTDAGLIPTGELAPVAGTPMDFTRPTAIGARIDADFTPLHLAGGYDHCWVLRPGPGPRRAARLRDPASGRVLEIFTDQPGIQYYSGNFLDGSFTGKGGARYARRSALCLETQNFPDAPNQPGFPSALLLPGQTYRHRMVHAFGVE